MSKTWKEAKSKDGEAVQHSILTTACLHKKERVWSASTVSMSACWAKKGEFCPEECVFHNINFTAQQDQTANGQSCWLKCHYIMYMASGVNTWFQYYLLDKKVIAFVVCLELVLTFYCVVHSFHNKLKAILSYNSIYSHSGWLPFEIEHFCALLTPKGRALEVSSLKGAVHIAIQTKRYGSWRSCKVAYFINYK